ncbi:MAG TPA: hypothetical protein VIJ50_02945 [Solirubrobacteraceae bacterium]
MIRLSIFSNELSPRGELVDHLTATVQIKRQELTARHAQHPH